MFLKAFISVLTPLILISSFQVSASNAGVSNAKASNKMSKIMDRALTQGVLTKELRTKIEVNFLSLIADKVLVAATIKQNQSKVPLAEIKKIDLEWREAEDFLPVQEEKQSNGCAKRLRKLMSRSVVEIFVMDNQGAIVCENDLTSDYWQGDESKWTNSYKDGKGGIDVGKLKLDQSVDAMIQQISLPMFDTNGSVIGAITIGVVPSRL